MLLLLNVADEAESEWPGIEIRPVAASLDAAYPLVLAAGADGADLGLTLVHDEAFENADRFLAEVSDAIGALAAARGDSGVGALVPEFAGRASERPNGGAPGPVPPDEPAVGAAGTGLPDAMLKLWRDVLGSNDAGVDDDFFGLGGTSLQAMELLARLERLVGRPVPVSTLFSAGSVRGLLAELGRPLEHAAPLVRLRSSGTRRPLVAVPGIGGNVLGLAGLARALGPDQPFYALQSPGLDGRETPLTTIESIAARYVEQVLTAVPGPYDLLGFCWGAAVAFEMAGRLQSAGRAPLSLQLIDPAALLRDTSSGGASAEATFLRRRLELYWGELRDADWRERGRFVAGKARRVAGVLAGDERRDESREELNRFKVERANRQAIARYIPGRYHGRATVFLSSGRVFTDGQDPRLEWLQFISPVPDILHVDGADSGDVISPAHVAAFATMLRDRLDAPAEPATAR
jgi:thioesterase domain-containing protein